MKTLVLALAMFVVAPVFASAADQRLEALMEATWNSELEAAPLMAHLFGDDRFKDQIGSATNEALVARRQRLEKAIAELKQIPLDEVTGDNRIHHRVFEWMLVNEKKTLETPWRLVNFNTITGWQTLFAQVAALTSFDDESDYRAYLKRLNAFGGYADENMGLMRQAMAAGYTHPCETLTGYETSISGYISDSAESSLFYRPFAQLPDSMSADVRTSLQAAAAEAITQVVNPAYQRYLAFFKRSYLPTCRKQVGLSNAPGGSELYSHLVNYFTTLNTDPETVHDLGLSEVTRIREAMDAIITQVEFSGSFSDFLEFLRTDPQFYPPDEMSYMAQAALIAKRADGLLPEYFAYLPKNPYGIIPVPAAIAPKATTAYYQPGAANGTRAGQYVLNLYDLSSRPLYELPALTLHEAVPGHHLQISIQQELENMPAFRRQYYFHAYGEGWGLYSELLGEEMGIYQTPYEQFGRLVYEMWRACRLVVDTGMHAKGWSRKQAIDFMAENTALSLHNITAEVDRYITYPGQALAYKLGEIKIKELRARAEQALGSTFSLRDFHTLVLTNGSVPLLVLEETVDRWIAEQQTDS